MTSELSSLKDSTKMQHAPQQQAQMSFIHYEGYTKLFKTIAESGALDLRPTCLSVVSPDDIKKVIQAV